MSNQCEILAGEFFKLEVYVFVFIYRNFFKIFERLIYFSNERSISNKITEENGN